MDAHQIDPREAISQHRAEQINRSMLLRSLMSHKKWMIEVEPPEQSASGERSQPKVKVQVGEDGKRSVRLFSDEQAAKDYMVKHGRDALSEHLIEAPGFAAFSVLNPELDFVVINPESNPELRYEKEQIPMLRAWASAVEIERVLATLDDSPEAFARIKRHPAFFLVTSSVTSSLGNHESLVMAPDDEGRKLAAVFTAEDCCEAFVAAASAALQTAPKVKPVSGVQMCKLLSETKADGVVFNCLGPVHPYAFSAEMFQLVLNAP